MIEDRFGDATQTYTEFRNRTPETGQGQVVEGAIASVSSSTVTVTPGGGGTVSLELPQSITTSANVQFGSIRLGSTDQVKGITRDTVSVDPGSIAANTRGTVTATITGLAATDFIALMPPAALDAGLLFVGAYISAADTVTIMLYNATGSPIDDSARDWEYLWMDFT